MPRTLEAFNTWCLLLLWLFPPPKNDPHLLPVPSCPSPPAPSHPLHTHLLPHPQRSRGKFECSIPRRHSSLLPYSSSSNKWALKQIDPRRHDSFILTQPWGPGRGWKLCLGADRRTKTQKYKRSRDSLEASHEQYAIVSSWAAAEINWALSLEIWCCCKTHTHTYTSGLRMWA